MKTIYFLVAIILTSSSNLIAQSNWKAATLTTVKGEVLSGEIDDRQWSSNIETVNFRKNKTSLPKSFVYSDVKRMLIGNQEYIGTLVNYNASPRNKEDLIDESNRIDRSRFGLLKVLIGGNVDLMQFYDKEGRDHYFIRDAKNNIQYLEYGTYLKKLANNESRVIEVNQFQVLLLDQFKGCNFLSGKIISTSYSKKSLERIFKDYYKCINEEIEQEVVKSSSWSIGPTLGVSKLFPRFRNNAIAIALSDLSPTVVMFGGKFLYHPLGLDGSYALVFSIEHYQYEFSDDSSQRNLYKQEQTIRFATGPRVYFTNSPYALYGEIQVGYDLLLKFNQVNSSSVDQKDINGSGRVSIGVNVGVKFGKADLAIKTFVGNRNLPLLPKESLYGIVGAFGYNF